MSYHCGQCGLGVIIIENESPIKACNHKAPILMDMDATLEGKGGVTN